MEIDRRMIKALAADARLEILKALKQRRKMPSELSRELDLAPSTIIEHLKILEESGLVARKETGRKWIYYELTTKGDSLIKPRLPVEFVLILSLGVLLIFTGAVNLTYTEYQTLENTITKQVEKIIRVPVSQGQGIGATMTPNPVMYENKTVIENVTTNEVTTTPITKINYTSLAFVMIGTVLLVFVAISRKFKQPIFS